MSATIKIFFLFQFPKFKRRTYRIAVTAKYVIAVHIQLYSGRKGEGHVKPSGEHYSSSNLTVAVLSQAHSVALLSSSSISKLSMTS